MPEKALPWVNYNRGRLLGICPDCQETIDCTLNIHWPPPKAGWIYPKVRADPIEHTCGGSER